MKLSISNSETLLRSEVIERLFTLGRVQDSKIVIISDSVDLLNDLIFQNADKFKSKSVTVVPFKLIDESTTMDVVECIKESTHLIIESINGIKNFGALNEAKGNILAGFLTEHDVMLEEIGLPSRLLGVDLMINIDTIIGVGLKGDGVVC